MYGSTKMLTNVCTVCSARLITNFGNFCFGFFVILVAYFFTLNFRFACLALLSKEVNKLLHNILVTSLPKTAKNQVTKMG